MTDMLIHAQTKNIVKNFVNKPAHAVGILGENGAGKANLALYIASSLLNITMAAAEKNPYIMIIKSDENSAGIETVREIQQFLTLSVPGRADIRRVVIIEDVDNLGREAQNAMLKTLEETPANTVIILTISRYENVMPTIHSRIQRIQMNAVDQNTAINYFKDEYEAEDIKKAFLISAGAAGLMHDILDQNSENALLRSIDQAREILRQSRYERIVTVDKLLKNKATDVTLFLDGLFRLLHASYRFKVAKNPLASEVKKDLLRMRLVSEAINDLDSNVSQKLVMLRLLNSL